MFNYFTFLIYAGLSADNCCFCIKYSIFVHYNYDMKKLLVLCLWFMMVQYIYGQSKRILFHTAYGDVKVLLYDFTPKHRDLIVDAIQDSVYANAFFNRIIKDFVVQGGEHDDAILKREQENPSAPKQRLDPEFDERAFHKIGALGAGRDDNPRKASFLNQLYFVVGKAVTADDLDRLQIQKDITYTDLQRKEYLDNGGLPRLDKDYTVVGEIYEGLDVMMKISRLQTDAADYPLTPVSFNLSLIK